MPELVFFRRGEEVLRFNLDKPVVVLGRGEKCDVVIPDPELSRQQVSLRFEGERCIVEDLSGKGTQVGGQKVSKGPIDDGQDIVLGQWRAVYRQSVATTEAAETQIGQQTEVVEKKSGDTRFQAQVRVKAQGQEQVHRLRADAFTVGKDAGNDLVLDHRFISSRHLKIARVDDKFHVVDQQSTNGTWLGPVRVFEAEVPFFTTLKVGETELSLEPAGLGATKGATSYEGIIGTDAAIRQLAELIERVAPSTAAIAILGESGTGKELVARALHNRSPRREQAFIPVNCAAISKELIESELFGHEKGAFTGAMNARKGAFEEADGGTIFLDEIGELPLDLQAKLLRALESGEVKRVGATRPMNVDVRVVAATNRDLLGMAREGKFREDLYYRLCVVPLTLPPLRSRVTDLVLLAEHFVQKFVPRGQAVHLTSEAIARLKQHRWPGNVRELKNVIHRALLLRKGQNLEAHDMTFDSGPSSEAASKSIEYQPGVSLEEHVGKYEKAIVAAALHYHGDNRERTAKELGVARSTFFKKLKDWGFTDAES